MNILIYYVMDYNVYFRCTLELSKSFDMKQFCVLLLLAGKYLIKVDIDFVGL